MPASKEPAGTQPSRQSEVRLTHAVASDGAPTAQGLLARLKSSPLLLLILFLLIVCSATVPLFDYELTRYVHDLKLRPFEDLYSRTLFEGEPPGVGDVTIIGMFFVLVAYARSGLGAWKASISRWRPSLGFAVFGAIASALCLVHGTKWVIGRARPYEVIEKGLAYTEWFEIGPHYISQGVYRGSFPSGHTAAALLPMLLAYALAGDPAHGSRTRLIGYLLGLVALANAIAMAVARSMSYRHWMSDGLLGALMGWALIHVIYYWVLRVPEQNRFLVNAASPVHLSSWWEMRLGLLVLGATFGVMCALLGVRALFIPQAGWYALLIPFGILAGIFFVRHTRRSYRKFTAQLTAAKSAYERAAGRNVRL